MLQTFGVAKHGMIPDYIYDMQFNEWYMVYGGVVLVANTIQRCVFSTVLIHYCSTNREAMNSALHVLSLRKSSASHTRSHESPLLGLAPIFATWITVALYLYLQPIILHYHLVPFVFYVGLINAYSVGRIIIAHLTKDPQFPYHNILATPLLLAVLDSVGLRLGLWPSVLGDSMYQIAFMFACLGLSIGIYGSFVVKLDTVFEAYNRLLTR